MSPDLSDHIVFLSYALFKADPGSKPPFSIELGLSNGQRVLVENCAHIPDGVSKIEEYSKQHALSFHQHFSLLYPIYPDAMETSDENTMMNIAWLIKNEADMRTWNFDRIEGYTGKTTGDFLFC